MPVPTLPLIVVVSIPSLIPMHHGDESHHHGIDSLLCDFDEKFEHGKLKLGVLLADLATGDDEDIGILLGRAGLLAFAGGLAPTSLEAAQTAT